MTSLTTPVVTRFLMPTEDGVLLCPICGYNYVFVTSVEVTSPGTKKGKVRIDGDGISIDPKAPPVMRGTEVVLRLGCGEGHNWTITTRFHKGMTCAESVRVHAPDDRLPIWRD